MCIMYTIALKIIPFYPFRTYYEESPPPLGSSHTKLCLSYPKRVSAKLTMFLQGMLTFINDEASLRHTTYFKPQ